MYQVKTNQSAPVSIQFEGATPFMNGAAQNWDLLKINKDNYHIIKDDKTYKVSIVLYNEIEKTLQLRINNRLYTVEVKDRFDILLEEMGMDQLTTQKANDLKAPMPGLVLRVLVEEQQVVKKGDSLILLEAMKMENVLKAAGDGVIKKIVAQEKTTVEKGQLLIQME